VQRSFDKTSLPRTDETPAVEGVGSIMRVGHTRHHLLLDAHINPSAGTLLVLSRALEPKALLYGFSLFALPNDSIVYDRSQVHFAPTHWVEIFMYDPASGVDRQIYPLKPYDQPRLAFMREMKKAYDRAGEAFCRENNHHCNPELFDSSWGSSWVVDREAGTFAFLVRFGTGDIGRRPQWPDDKVAPRDVIVTCRNAESAARVTCGERWLEALQSAHPHLQTTDLLKIAARQAASPRR
jgi:hypothetical protein